MLLYRKRFFWSLFSQFRLLILKFFRLFGVWVFRFCSIFWMGKLGLKLGLVVVYWGFGENNFRFRFCFVVIVVIFIFCILVFRVQMQSYSRVCVLLFRSRFLVWVSGFIDFRSCRVFRIVFRVELWGEDVFKWVFCRIVGFIFVVSFQGYKLKGVFQDVEREIRF